ncbi:MAG: hypothetical protein ACRCTD_07825 [Beijerinckiaceae bacterium]
MLAQNKGTVRGMEMSGYGRMILTLQDMPTVQTSVTSGVLIVTFQSPVTIDPEKLPGELPNYIGAARRDPDGKALRFALGRNLRPHLKEAGERVFIDLLPDNWKGQPPGLPQDVVDELARRAREAEEALKKSERKRLAEETRAMPVRVGRMPTFTRMVFEMPAIVPVKHKKDGESLELIFDAALKVDVARLRIELGDAVKSVENQIASGTSVVRVVLNDNVDAHTFREDDTFVVDLVNPDAKAARPSPEAPNPDVPAVPKQPLREASKAAANPADAKAAVAPPMAAAPVKVQEVAVAQEISSQPVVPKISRDGDTVRLAFKFGSKIPAALFVRNGIVTALFETQQPLVISAAHSELSAIGGTLAADPMARAQLVRIAFPEQKLARLAADGDSWILTIGEKLSAASEPIAPSRMIDDNGRTVVTLPLQRASMVHWIEDPETGERIAVATALAPLRSVAKPYRFPEFELAATAHGVAVVAQADDISVLAGVDDVTIERGNGLSVTPRAERVAADSGGIAQPVVFDRVQWTQDKAGVPRERMRALQHQAADAPRGRRNQFRYALGKMYFTNGLFAEARGAFESIVFTDPAAARDRNLAIMRIASAVQMQRGDDARKLMQDDVVRDDPEAMLWRAVLDARERNWPRALAGFRSGEGALEAYPEALQAPMRLLWARAAVEVRDYGTATNEIESVEKMDREFANVNDVALLRARVDEGQGRIDDAMNAYTRIYDSQHRPAAAEAGMRGALLGLQDKAISREDAIVRLETVSAIWRGDGAVEAETMAALGRFYAEDNRWRDAFGMARRANEVYPNNEKIRSLHDEAARLFESVFLEGKGDSIDRVQALALFYDFKELTPPGRRGDEIVRQLAERLVALDLLDNAAMLLQHQIDSRLKGAQRATVAARLAIIYLMDRKPAAAVQALRSTRLPELPYHIKRARALLEARALSDLSRTDLALDIAGAETGPDVDRLTADIQWQGRRWRAAGETYERILGERWKSRDELSDAERADIVRAAIAYALAEETLSMDRLRGKYSALMANSSDARAFQLITSPAASRAREFRELARTVARADTLAEFLSEYRKRYPDIPMTMPQREKTPPPPVAEQAPKPEPIPARPGSQATAQGAGQQG